MQELMTFLWVQEVSQALRPSILEVYKNLYKLLIIFQLGINDLNIRFVFSK